MGRLEVQGIVSVQTGEPLVQVRQVDDEGNSEYGFQCSPADAREMAQNFQEAATNAVYDAAIISWAKEMDGGAFMGLHLVDAVRRHRADKWGLPDQPEDWRTKMSEVEEPTAPDSEPLTVPDAMPDDAPPDSEPIPAPDTTPPGEDDDGGDYEDESEPEAPDEDAA